MHKATIIHPVIMAVPGPERTLKGRDKVTALRRIAREALQHSAQLSGVVLGELEKAGNGAPLPSNGVYWSLTHKSSYVAAVTAPHSIGIDIEKKRTVSEGMYRRIAQSWEWELAPKVSQALFSRYWTAKEAVLKAMGVGLTGLSRCRIAKILDDTHLELTYDDSVWRVTQYWIADHHIVAVTTDDVDIEWHQLD
ncbi:MAG: 4'-phosphopantetheinyl transferase superfamily protein [Desulfobacteraceae bacterium]|jgi:4'-phosphopantetheinyl transferase